MAFTAGSVELARATRLGQKLSAYHNSMSGNGGITTGRDLQLINKLARNGRLFTTGFTSGAGFPPIGTNNLEGLTHSNNAATYNAGTTLGANVGLTLGVFYKTLNTALLTGNGGSVGVSFGLVVPSGITGYAQNLQGFTATINMVTGAVN